MVALAVSALTAPCLGQQQVQDEGMPESTGLNPADLPPPPPIDTQIKFSVATGFQYLFQTDLETTGTVSIARAGLEIGTQVPLRPDLQFIANLRYEFDAYDFSPTTGLGADPWGDVNWLSIDGRLQWAINRRAIVFGGAVVQSIRETDASWSGSWTGGGTAGFTWVFDQNLQIGFGLGVISQIRDPVLVYPIVILNWRINDQMRLTSVAGPAGIAATGLEFVYTIGSGWEVGAGGRYEFRRFLLNQTGVAPGGAGEETNWPFWVRLSYRFNQNLGMDLYGGFALGGNLSVEGSNGVTIAEQSYGITPTLAFALRVRF